MQRWVGGHPIGAIFVIVAGGLVTACNQVGPNRREIVVTGTVYFNQVPDSGWTVLLNMPAASSGGGGFCLGLCGGGHAFVGESVSGPDGTYTIVAEVEENVCDQMGLQLGARSDRGQYRVSQDGPPPRGMPCGFAPGYDYRVDSAWP